MSILKIKFYVVKFYKVINRTNDFYDEKTELNRIL